MNEPLMRRAVGKRSIRVWMTSKSVGDVHPHNVTPSVLRSRQRSATGAEWVMADQVHGTKKHVVESVPEWQPTQARADVLATRLSGVQLAVWAADCGPLVLASTDGTIVAAHVGWRGLATGVVNVAAAQTRREGGATLFAALGPVIHPCCYEFGEEELTAVARGLDVGIVDILGETSDGATALDMPAAIRLALSRHGVTLDYVGPCTGCSPLYYSHRVGQDPERHAIVIDQIDI